MTGTELARRAGVSYRKVDYWARTGVLVPTQGPATPGCGSQRRYSEAQIPAVKVLDRLMSIRDTSPKGQGSIVWEATRRIVEHVVEHGPRGQFELIPGVTVDVAKVLRSHSIEEAA